MSDKKRIRDLMTIPGNFLPGIHNSITDVPGVTASHVTIIDESKEVRTGITLISPCKGDVFVNPLPAAAVAGNGYGKMTGMAQIEEMGTLESLVGLTNTMSVAAVLQGLAEYHMPLLPSEYKSINIVVGETNDSNINDIHGFHVWPSHVGEAIAALSKNVEEGAVGAGAGTVCFGFKGGIGTSSRVVPGEKSGEERDYTVGVLVQSNYGGNLSLYGKPVPKPSNNMDDEIKPENGSCMIIVMTDAPLSSRQLKRLAKRALIGMTNTGSYMGNGSGDFCLAASNHEKNRRIRERKGQECYYLQDSQLNPFFEACADATQEALYNSMTMSETVVRGDRIYPGLRVADANN